MSRSTDFVLGLFLALLLTPLMFGVALFVLLSGGWPVLHIDPRLGRGQKVFGLIKFRSLEDASGPAVTTAQDRRLKPWGRFLRRLHLDELPQLWQVVSGELALLGPRPESPRLARLDDPRELELLQYRPGFIDPDLDACRGEAEELSHCEDPESRYRDVIRPQKIERALLFVRQRGWRQDASGLLAALSALLKPRKAT